MTEAPSQKPWALTKARIFAILDDDVYRPDKNLGLPPWLLPAEMRFMDFTEKGQAPNRTYLTALETRAWIEQWCRDAFVLVEAESQNENLGTHFEQLDALFSTLITCNFQLERHRTDRTAIVDSAYAVLQRLPRHPAELTFEYSRRSRSNKTNSVGSQWPPEYLCASSPVGIEEEDAPQGYSWADLQVLSRPCTNVIRTALWLCMDRTNTITTYNYADTIVKVLDTLTDLQKTSATESGARAWFVLTAFFWSAWQQTVMLQLSFDAAIRLDGGYASNENYHIVAREIPSVMPSRETVERSRPRYMCKWAFELLRADLSSVTQDFRTLFEVYERQFGGRESRCNVIDSARVCDGKAPVNCERFQSDRVKDQSAHDFQCPGSSCSLLTWDEQSYMSIKGARAVCLETTDDKLIRYRPISGENMAVSHVWSHGQGGRPETGFNLCLHRRYTELARSLGCTSYWMDSPCIPTDDDLRDEAIGQINDNFINSKLVLLVDRDLMEIDIEPLTLAAEETILAALVVCDWNVRAWTLLEGIRGRANLHILCKDNRVIPLKTILKDTLSKSCLSLASACLAIQHYTPTRDHVDLVKTEQATCLLNHRHPTKDRDIIIIWSLVCGSSKVVKTAEAFWRSMVGGSLATGFLVSSSPRIKGIRGLSWAPERPNLVPPVSTATSNGAAGASSKGLLQQQQYPAFNGHNSVEGTITPDGFQAEWLACRIQRRRALPGAGLFSLHGYAGPRIGIEGYYQIYNEGANDKMDVKSLFYLRSVVAPLFKRYRWVSLLLPAWSQRGGNVIDPPLKPFRYQGECEGLLMAIVASNDEAGSEWEWQGVHEWDAGFRLPEFSCTHILIV
ncbi:hypothetical protein BDV10DRAFT_165390 [Aspergillus recurvatus]